MSRLLDWFIPVCTVGCFNISIGLITACSSLTNVQVVHWSASLHPPPSALVKCPRKLKQGQLTTKQTRVNQTGWNEISTILREIGRGQRAKNQQQLFIRIVQSDFQVALEGSEIHVFFLCFVNGSTKFVQHMKSNPI